MKIYCQFDPKFVHVNINQKQTDVDIDAQETVDNLKVFLTLKYQDVDPEIFDVYFNNKRLNPEEVIFRTGLQDGSKVVIKPKVSSCCVIF